MCVQHPRMCPNCRSPKVADETDDEECSCVCGVCNLYLYDEKNGCNCDEADDVSSDGMRVIDDEEETTSASDDSDLPELIDDPDRPVAVQRGWPLEADRTPLLEAWAKECHTTVAFVGGRHGHAQAAIERRAAEDYMYSLLGEKTAVAIGGSKRDDKHKNVIWRTNPVVDDVDFGRDVQGPNVCDHLVQDCKCSVDPDVFVATHVYLEANVVAKLCARAKTGFTYACFHNIKPRATYWNGEAESWITKDGMSYMKFRAQPPYKQTDMQWLTRFSAEGVTWCVEAEYPNTVVVRFQLGGSSPPPQVHWTVNPLAGLPNIRVCRDLLAITDSVILFTEDSPIPILLDDSLCEHAVMRASQVVGVRNADSLLNQALVQKINGTTKKGSFEMVEAYRALTHITEAALHIAARRRTDARDWIATGIAYPERDAYSADAQGVISYNADWNYVRRLRHLRTIGYIRLQKWLAQFSWREALQILGVLYLVNRHGPQVLAALRGAVSAAWQFSGNLSGVLQRMASLVGTPLAATVQGRAMKLPHVLTFLHDAIAAPIYEELVKRVPVVGPVFGMYEAIMKFKAGYNPSAILTTLCFHEVTRRLPLTTGIAVHGWWNTYICAFLHGHGVSSRGVLMSIMHQFRAECAVPRKECLEITTKAEEEHYDLKPSLTANGPYCPTYTPIVPALSTNNEYAAIQDRILIAWDRTDNPRDDWLECLELYHGKLLKGKIRPNKRNWRNRFSLRVRQKVLEADRLNRQVEGYRQAHYFRRSMFPKWEMLDKMEDVENDVWTGPRPIEACSPSLNADLGPSYFATSKLMRANWQYDEDKGDFGPICYATGMSAEDVTLWFAKAQDAGYTHFYYRDKKRFDASVGMGILRASEKVHKRMGWSETRLRRMMAFHNKHTFRTKSGIVVSTSGRVSTGFPGTSAGNSIDNLECTVSSMLDLGVPDFRVILMADDDVLATKVPVDPTACDKYGLKTKAGLTFDPLYCDFISCRPYFVEPYCHRGVWLDTCFGPKIAKQLLKIGWDKGGLPGVALKTKLRSELISHLYDWAHVPILADVLKSGLEQTQTAKGARPTKDAEFYLRTERRHHPSSNQPHLWEMDTVTPANLVWLASEVSQPYPRAILGAHIIFECDQG